MAQIYNPWAPSETDEPPIAAVNLELRDAGQPLEWEDDSAFEDDEMPQEHGPTPVMAQAMKVIADQSALIQSLMAQVKI